MSADKSDPIEQPTDQAEESESHSRSDAEEFDASIPTNAKQDFADLIVNILTAEQAGFAEDCAKFETYNKDSNYWLQQSESLLQAIHTVLPASHEILSGCRRLFELFNAETQEKLKGRQEGFELIDKMLDRLKDQAANLSEKSPSEELHPLPSQEELIALLVNQESRELAQKVLEKNLKEIGNQRWQTVAKSRDTAQQYRKRFIHFVEKRVLNVLDGIDSGEQNSQTLVESIKAEYLESADNLTQWFETYSELRQLLIGRLNQLGIYQMQVEKGSTIDYEKHEPFDVEPDEDLKDEDIKEVVRKGYEYALDPSSSTVLRAAQVIVVKN